MIQVKSLHSSNRFILIFSSATASKWLVASSNIKTCGSRNSALAIASFCFCPPDKFLPFSSIGVSYPKGSFSISSFAPVIRHAFSISSSLTLGFPRSRFFLFTLHIVTAIDVPHFILVQSFHKITPRSNFAFVSQQCLWNSHKNIFQTHLNLVWLNTL